jgi:Outer membrane protein W
MTTRLALLSILLATFLSPAFAQRTSVEAGARYADIRFRGRNAFGDGDLEIPGARGWAATLEWFRSPRVSVSFESSFFQPRAFLLSTQSPLAEVDLNVLAIDTHALTARLHFRPQARISPFVGAGGALVVFGVLDDRFGDQIHADLPRRKVPVFEAGIRFPMRPRVTIALAATYMPLDAELRVDKTNRPLPASLEVDPVTVTAGASWRF